MVELAADPTDPDGCATSRKSCDGHALQTLWVGLVALQAPLLSGPLLGTILALGLGAPPRTLLYWMFASIVVWGVVLTGAAALGLSVFSG